MDNWCLSCKFEDYDSAKEPCYNCVTSYDEKPSEFSPKPITHADRIRAMSDNEMAEWIHKTRHNPLYDLTMSEWLHWLKQGE